MKYLSRPNVLRKPITVIASEHGNTITAREVRQMAIFAAVVNNADD